MDNPFADLIPKKPATNPFADLIPKKPATNPLADLIPKKPAPLHDANLGALPGAKTDAPPTQPGWTPPLGYKPTGEVASASDRGPDTMHAGPLTSAMLDPNRPIGQRVLAGVGHVAGGMLRAGPDAVQRAVQSLRQGEQPSVEDIGTGAMSMLPGALEGARGAPKPLAAKPRVEPPPLATPGAMSMLPGALEGARGAPKPLAAKPRVEPPPLATPGAPNSFESLVPRNAEGRPVVPAGGLKPEANPFADLVPKVDPRAAAAGETAVRKVADRTGKPQQKNAAKPKAAKPKAAKPKAAKPTPQTWHDFVADPKALPLPKGKTTKPDSPFDKWYKEIYQTGKHGEGLPMSDLARKSRAKKQGFNTGLTLYHGTGNSDFLRFDMAKHQSENAIFLSDDPKVSKAYSFKGSTPAVIPLWAKMENPKTMDWKGQHYGSTSDKFRKAIDQAKAEGHDVVIIKNIYDSGSSAPQTQYAFFKPGNIRSQKSAAFDPKVKEPDAHLLSAAGTPTADLLRLNKADYDDKLPKAPGAVQIVKNAVQTLKSILAPQTMNASAERAAGSIRKNIGRGVQDSERAKLAMEPYRKMLQNDTLEEQLTVLKWLQQPDTKIAKGLEPSDELKPFLQAFKDLMLDRRAKLEARSKTGDMGFKDDYVSQMWKDPDAARDVLHSLGPKEGSNSFTKRSVIDDYEAGIKAGLIPLTTDPVEIAMRYVENVDRFIAINDVLEEGAANKDIVWRAPEHAPNGWVKLDGRARSFKGGAFQDAYAPPGYADVYNAFVSKPPQGAWGDVLGAAQKVSNSVSAFKLAVSGYHALNIAGEANVAGLANAIDKLAGGDALGAAKGAVGSPAKFVTSVARGRQMLNTYMTGMGSPEMQKVVQLAVDANFRVAGKGRIADEYRFSSLGSLWDSWKKGLLKGELKEMGKGIKARPLVGSAKAIVSTAARALETMSDPLFKHYIPMVKNGAYFDMVKTWLDAHPGASVAEQTAFARKAADIIDNRFGEMNQDNIFWQRWQKQLAQTLVVSYSYELGTARLIGGAAKDAAGLAKGKGWSPNLSYAIALPVMIGAMGAAYQYIKTGKPPESPRDMMYPQTGGQDPMSGQPARAVLPSYMGQFVNAYFGGLTREIANKKNGIFDLLSAAFTGQDWRGDPITAVDDSTTDAIKKWLGYAAGTWEPILASQTRKGGAGISGGERFAGIREAPMFANDPAAYKRMTEAKRLQADAEAAWHKRNADLEAKGQHPNFHVKRQFIRDYMARHKPGYGGAQ